MSMIVGVAVIGALVAAGLIGWRATRPEARDPAMDTRSPGAVADLHARLDDLALTLDRTRQSEAAKAAALSDMVRTLRPPVNGLLGLARTMRPGSGGADLPYPHLQALEALIGHADRLRAELDALEDLCALEGVGLDLRPQRIDPQVVIGRVCADLTPRATQAGVALRPGPVTPGLALMADAARLEQALAAVLTWMIGRNAPGGVVLIETDQTPDGVTLALHDTTPQGRLGPSAPDHRATRRLVEAMDGRLDIHLTPGQGASVVLRLPGAPGVTQAQAAPRHLGQGVVVHIGASQADRLLVRRLVGGLGPVRLHGADTAGDGLSLARDLRPDAVLLDFEINDPGVTRLVARLRADPLTADLPLIGLSHSARPTDVRRARREGLSACLCHPLDGSRLAEALAPWLGESRDPCARSVAA